MNLYCFNSYEFNSDRLYEKISTLQFKYDQLVNEILYLNQISEKYKQNIFISNKPSTNTTTFIYIKNLHSFFLENQKLFNNINLQRKDKLSELKGISYMLNETYYQLDILEEIPY